MARLVGLIVALLGLAVAGPSFAGGSIPVGGGHTYEIGAFGVHSSGSSPGDVCSQFASAISGGPNGRSYTGSPSPDGGACVLYFTVNGQNNQYGNTVAIQDDGPGTGCGPNSTFSGGVCQCNGNASASAAGTCDLDNPPKTDDQCKAMFGSSSGDGTTKYDWSGGSTACHGGCVSTPSSMYGSGSNQWATGPWTVVGGACDGTGKGGGGAPPDNGRPTPPGATTDPAATQCTGANQCVGQVNGQTICVACTSETSQGTTTTTSTAPDGTVTPGDTVTKSTSDNGNGTTTTTTTTTHPDGSSTTSTSTGPKGGSGGSASSPSSSASGAGGFCDQNPTASICKQSQFGGACGGAFTCDGDAIQCAIAKEQHERDCAFYDPASQPGQLGDHAAKFNQALTDGTIPSWSPAASANQGSTDIDFQSRVKQTKHWGSECVADSVIASSTGGPGYVIPWSHWCSQMALIGKLVLAVGWLVCLRIVFM